MKKCTLIIPTKEDIRLFGGHFNSEDDNYEGTTEYPSELDIAFYSSEVEVVKVITHNSAVKSNLRSEGWVTDIEDILNSI